MIYLIKTYGKGQEAFKIGYTADDNYKQRISAYETHNPFVEIVHIIPEATEIHEKRLHYKFRDLLLFKNEWFKCEQEIVDYIKTATLEDLDNLDGVDLNIKLVKKYRETIRVSYDLATKSTENKDFENKKEKMLSKLIKSRKKDYELSDIYSIFELSEEDIMLVKKIVDKDYSDLPKDLEQSILLILNEGEFTKKMKLLCDYEFTEPELDYVLQQLPSEFAKYYYTLGPEKIKAVLYRKYLLEDAYNKLMFNTTTMTNDIYSIFNEGEKLSTSDIIDRLQVVYDRYGNPNRPKAKDIENYFEIKTAKITLLDKSRINGFKLIKKLY